MTKRERVDKECTLAEVTRGVTRASLLDSTKKVVRLDMRITRAERGEIEEMCNALDMTISEYLSGLHRHAYRRWKDKQGMS